MRVLLPCSLGGDVDERLGDEVAAVGLDDDEAALLHRRDHAALALALAERDRHLVAHLGLRRRLLVALLLRVLLDDVVLLRLLRRRLRLRLVRLLRRRLRRGLRPQPL